MRIATYNLWNSDTNWTRRFEAIGDELRALDADVVALQEVPIIGDAEAVVSALKAGSGHSHALHLPYPDEPDEDDRPEGLALLSRVPFESVTSNWAADVETANNWAIRVVLTWDRVRLGVTNVHLDWESPAGRQTHIADIVDRLALADPADHEILCGDFNCYGDGPVDGFLRGADGAGRWQDLALDFHQARGETPPVTLDFTENPRWANTEVDEIPGRFDRIYALRGGGAPLSATTAGIFGRRPRNRHALVASDHYGVFVDLARAGT